MKIPWCGCQQYHFYCGTQNKYWFIRCLYTTVKSDAAASSSLQGNRKLRPNYAWEESSPQREVRGAQKTDAVSSEWKYSGDQKLGSTKASNTPIKLIVLDWFYILAQRKKTQNYGRISQRKRRSSFTPLVTYKPRKSNDKGIFMR